MVEVVFSNSACGSLKVAQHYGEGPYRGGAVGVFFSGSPTKAEREAARREAEARAQRAWEAAVPLGGNSRDIYAVSLALSVGSIAEANFEAGRQRVFRDAFSIYPRRDAEAEGEKLLAESLAALCEVLQRAATGEALRIWYSEQPDEFCGLCHLCAMLRRQQHGEVRLVKLPLWRSEENSVTQYQGWGDVSPHEWHRFLSLDALASPAFLAHCAMYWQQLQEENLPLRAVVNGRLVGVEEAFYDGFLLREIALQGEEFRESQLIAAVLGKYALGIGDVLLHNRVEAMLRAGLFAVSIGAEADDPVYRRMLKKTALWYERFGKL